MVVMVIMMLVAGIVLVTMQPAIRDARMRSGCRMIASALNYARSNAVSTNTVTRVVFEQPKNALGQNAQQQSFEVDVPTNDGLTIAKGLSKIGEGQQLVALTTPAGRPRSLPEGVAITRIIKSGGAENEDWIDFTNLGQADQTLIELTDKSGQHRYIYLDPITGRCRILMTGKDKLTDLG